MQQTELVNRLDTFFSIGAFEEEDNWRPYMTNDEYATLARFAVPAFLNGSWNGLMLDNATEIEQVYLVVFPAQEVLDTIIAREVACGAPGALIFAHHLADYEESGRGFVQVSEEQLEELREHHISYYVCHAPLDCHAEISTTAALANALGLRAQGRFAPYYGGMAGVYGTVGNGPVSFQAFAARLAKVTDVDRLRYDQVRHNGQPVSRVAVVAGGGGDEETIREAEALGCDTYVTGHWWLFNKGDYPEQQRAEMREFLPTVKINLLGSSHYATEMVVMRDQMPGWFRAQGLDAELIRQQDPWR